MCDTRFIERHTAIEVTRNLLIYIVKSLEMMQAWNSSDTRSGAFNLECTILNQKFLTSVVMLEHITCTLKPTTVLLQAKQLDIVKGLNLVKDIIVQLEQMKCQEYWTKLFDEIVKLAELFSISITVPRRATISTMPEFATSISPKEHYGNVWRASLQNVIDDLKLKFGNDKKHLIYMQELIPALSTGIPTFETSTELLRKYQSLLPNTTILELEREICRWNTKWSSIYKKPNSALSALDETGLFPNIEKLLTILVMIPVTSREFSQKLKEPGRRFELA